MPKYPAYYVRPDGLHESILRINGKRKAFRGKSDKEVWEKIKAYDTTQAERPTAPTFSVAADIWWEGIEPTLEHNTLKSYRPAYERANAHFASMTWLPSPQGTLTNTSVNLPPHAPGKPL